MILNAEADRSSFLDIELVTFPRTVEFYLALTLSEKYICSIFFNDGALVDDEAQFKNLETAMEMILTAVYDCSNSQLVHAFLVWQFCSTKEHIESIVIARILLACIKWPLYKVTQPELSTLLALCTLDNCDAECSICFEPFKAKVMGIIGCGLSLATSKHFLCWECDAQRHELECPTCRGSQLIRGLIRRT